MTGNPWHTQSCPLQQRVTMDGVRRACTDLLTKYGNDCTKCSTTNNYFADFYCMKGRISDKNQSTDVPSVRTVYHPSASNDGIMCNGEVRSTRQFLIHQIRGSHHVINSPRRTEFATACATLQQD